MPDVSPIAISKDVAPFIPTDLLRLALLVACPWLVLRLPTTLS